MWVSKKKWTDMEKRVLTLEKEKKEILSEVKESLYEVKNSITESVIRFKDAIKEEILEEINKDL